MGLDGEMNFRLRRATKRALFDLARASETTAAAIVRGYVEAIVTNRRWAEAAAEAGVLTPSEPARRTGARTR